jgi:hypothetical protein
VARGLEILEPAQRVSAGNVRVSFRIVLPPKACAVVIGVSKTGGLRPLDSPIPGAKLIAELLRKNRYNVKLFTDEDEARPVTAAKIRAAIEGFIDQQPKAGYRLLVVYFSGHGYWKNQSDLWLLSNAPGDAGEAVSLFECVDLAKDSGIPNVVLISDACRSIPQGTPASRVRGSVVFPNRESAPGKRSKIDQLKASREGAAAFEAKIGRNGAVQSIFTHCLLMAFQKPDQDMVREVKYYGRRTIRVVPNHRLEGFLLREVEQALANVNITLSQEPEIDTPSNDDNVYIARVETEQPTAGDTSGKTDEPGSTAPTLTPADVAIANIFGLSIGAAAGPHSSLPPTESMRIASTRMLFQRALDASLVDTVRPLAREDLELIRATVPQRRPKSGRSRESAFLDDLMANLSAGGLGAAADQVAHFESGAGFTVTGGIIKTVMLNAPHHGGNPVEVLERGGGDRSGIVRVWLERRQNATLMLMLGNGRGVPLAALSGYIGHIFVRNGRVLNINYIPVGPTFDRPEPPRWDFYLQNQGRLERLRALAAVGIGSRAFRIGDPQRAERLAEVIRDAKGIDPTLGLYATYAYLEAGHEDKMRSVRSIMMSDLRAELFDVAMLARSRGAERQSRLPVAPFCPMLTQGWNYLRSREIELPAVLADAQDELVAGPWTMFKPARAKKVVYAMSSGVLSGG